MALRMFTIITEGKTDALAFSLAQQYPVMLGRIRYEIIDPTTTFPSDALAVSRAEHVFGVQPQADKVYIAGEKTNTVWAVRVLGDTGIKRLLFFGLTRV